MSKHFWAGPNDWDRVARALARSSERGDPVGLDSEFYGAGEGRGAFDVRKESCAGGRTRVHFWSVAIKRWPHELHPKGYHRADAAVLGGEALSHPGLRAWLESAAAKKVVHNLPVDSHALHGSGVLLRGAVNTLALARWCWPERARGRGFGLDALGGDLLGLGKAESYDELFSEEIERVVRVKEVRRTTCECGAERCRKRKGHEKTVTVEQVPVVKRVRVPVPLESVGPGHPLFARAVAYAARDAVVALALHDKIERAMRGEVPWPWKERVA